MPMKLAALVSVAFAVSACHSVSFFPDPDAKIYDPCAEHPELACVCDGNTYSLKCLLAGLPSMYGVDNNCTAAYLTSPDGTHVTRPGDLSDCHDLSGSDVLCCD